MLNLSSYPDPAPDPERDSRAADQATTALEPAQPRWAMVARAHVLDRALIPAAPMVRRVGQTRSYFAALSSVRDGLRRGDRLIVVTGQSGTGKTMLCRALIEDPEVLTHTSVMLQPPATPEDLLAHFLRDVGVLDNGTSAVLMTRNSLVFALQRFLESLIPVGGRAVLVIDEAQHLTPVVLEELRLALNFETNDSALLQVVLVGQPELDALLRWPELQRVAQRVARRCELTGVEPDEHSIFVDECLQRRLPGTLIRFTPAGERAVISLSNAVPRVADRLSTCALELANAENAYRIEPAVVLTAAQRLGIEVPKRKVSNRTWVEATAAAAACAVLAGALWGWNARAAGRTTPAASGAGNVAPATVDSRTDASGLTTGALETAGGLTVTVASFRTESRARAVVAQLVDQGLPAFERTQGDKGPYQVIVGPYVSAEEAVAAQKALAAQGAASTQVQLETADLTKPAWQ